MAHDRTKPLCVWQVASSPLNRLYITSTFRGVFRPDENRRRMSSSGKDFCLLLWILYWFHVSAGLYVVQARRVTRARAPSWRHKTLPQSRPAMNMNLQPNSSRPRRPRSLAETHTFRPKILPDNAPLPTTDSLSTVFPVRPRAVWNVADASLRPYPPYYPLLNSVTSRLVQSSPSTVAIRIAEYLRVANVASEFDDETNSAVILATDCVFTIHLWKSSERVMVDCNRVRGDTMQYHWLVRNLLKAATSQDPTVVRKRTATLKTAALPTSVTATALEQVTQLLRKDRVEAQQAGLERLVCLTDTSLTAPGTATPTALAVLGVPMGGTTTHTLLEQWILSLILHSLLPGETAEPGHAFAFSCASSLLSDHNDRVDIVRSASDEDFHHGATMRSLALNILKNALTVLNHHQPKLLHNLLKSSSPWTKAEFVNALIEDLKGATRPPTAVAGTRLASPHEARAAILSLKTLATSNNVKTYLLVHDSFLQLLEAAERAGQSMYDGLAQDARACYLEVTVDERSC